MINKKFLDVLQGKKLKSPPIWLMRQAGRYLPEYRKVRAGVSGFLELCYDPDKATEVTLQPIRRFGFDAAILFSDILVLPDALGQPVWFEEGIGPKLQPVQPGKFGSLRPFSDLSTDGNRKLQAVYTAVSNIRSSLPEDCALIGFAGGPWTVASYMIEGGSTRTFEHVRRWTVNHRESFAELIDLLVEATSEHLIGQIEAGAECVQIFESHAGELDSLGFEEWVIRPIASIVGRVHARFPDIPVIGFPRRAGAALPGFVDGTGVNAVGLDQSVSLDWIKRSLDRSFPVQGNLDPIYLLSNQAQLERGVSGILESGIENPFVFNLGHGVIKDTDPAMVEKLVRLVRG